MKKIILGLCLLLFTVSLNAEGKLLFDLNAQHFSNSILKKDKYTKGGRYDLPNAVVETDMYNKSHSYYKGTFTTTLKTMPKSWHVAITIFNYYDNQTLIRVGSNSGTSSILSIDDKTNTISINNKKFEVGSSDLYDKTLEIDIASINNAITFQINGQEFYKMKADEFKMLRDVQVSPGYNCYLSRLKVFSK